MKIIVSIGNHNQINTSLKYWKNKKELNFFKEKTKGNVLIVDESFINTIKTKFSDRKIILISKQKNPKADKNVSSKEEAIKTALLYNMPISIVGSAKHYEMFLDSVESMIITFVNQDEKTGDIFPEYKSKFDILGEENKDGFNVQYFLRKNDFTGFLYDKDKNKICRPLYSIDYKNEVFNKDFGIGMIADVETNGTSHDKNKVIELGYILFYYDKKTLKAIYPFKHFSGLQDPHEPLSEEISRITKIIDPMVKGKQINWEEVSNDVKRSDFVICHNAKFDRTFLENNCEAFVKAKFLCSMNDIPWQSEFGFEKVSMKDLCEDHGFYIYNAHRALNDVEALYHLLLHQAPIANFTYMEYLILKVRVVEYLILASNTGFESKPIFNEFSFSWFPEETCWHKIFNKKDDAVKVLSLIEDKVYGDVKFAKIFPLKAEHRYKSLKGLMDYDLSNYNEIKDLAMKNKLSKPLIIMIKETADRDANKSLKNRGYNFNRMTSSWDLYVSEEESQIEKKWCREKISSNGIFAGQIKKNKDCLI